MCEVEETVRPAPWSVRSVECGKDEWLDGLGSSTDSGSAAET